MRGAGPPRRPGRGAADSRRGQFQVVGGAGDGGNFAPAGLRQRVGDRSPAASTRTPATPEAGGPRTGAAAAGPAIPGGRRSRRFMTAPDIFDGDGRPRVRWWIRPDQGAESGVRQRTSVPFGAGGRACEAGSRRTAPPASGNRRPRRRPQVFHVVGQFHARQDVVDEHEQAAVAAAQTTAAQASRPSTSSRVDQHSQTRRGRSGGPIGNCAGLHVHQETRAGDRRRR